MPADGCPWNTWQTRIQVPKSLRIRYLCEPALENCGFEARKTIKSDKSWWGREQSWLGKLENLPHELYRKLHSLNILIFKNMLQLHRETCYRPNCGFSILTALFFSFQFEIFGYFSVNSSFELPRLRPRKVTSSCLRMCLGPPDSLWCTLM